eukprot:c2871_g1_i1 orf=88-1470(+)
MIINGCSRCRSEMRWCASYRSNSSALLASAMAALPFFLLLLLLPLSARADSELHSDGVHPPVPPKCEDDPALLHELHLIKGQLHDLDESSLEKDLVIHDKEKIISSLRSEVDNLKKKESLQYDNVLKELGSKVTGLEEDLAKAELEVQEAKSKAKTLEAAQSLHSSRIKELEKLVSEQKKQISKAELALRAAEATLLRVREEADAKDKELLKVHGGWLPPWTSIKLVKLQESAAEHWTKYGQPIVDTSMKKVSEKVSAAQKVSKPYVDNLKTHAQQKWNPVLKRTAETVSATVSPHFETAKSKIVEGYEASKDFISPQLEKAKDVMGPHIQVAKEKCRPYVDEAAAFVKPYYKQVQSITRPYTDKVFQSYRSFLISAATYHSQLQVSMKGKMQDVDFLAPLASNELVWFLSAALLVLPVIFAYLFFSSALGPSKKPVKPAKSHHGGHAHKKAKRAKQADK